MARGNVSGQRVGGFDANSHLPTLSTPPPQNYGGSPPSLERLPADRLSVDGSIRSGHGLGVGAMSGPGSAHSVRSSVGSGERQPKQQQQRRLPPMCPGLILPHSESLFAMDWQAFLSGREVELIGRSGRPLLRSITKQGSDRLKEVRVGLPPSKSPILGAAVDQGDDVPFLIRGTTETTYGRVSVALGRMSLTHQDSGMEVLSFSQADANGHLFATTRDGTVIAAACRCTTSNFFANADHLEVRVSPDNDSVLVLCCVLGAIAFGRLALTPGPHLAQSDSE